MGTKTPTQNKHSAFTEQGLEKTIDHLIEEIQELYQADEYPWVVGYSGGKDSTAVLQLVWLALLGLPKKQRNKPVHVISTDTLVENPVVADWVYSSLKSLNKSAKKQGLPLTAHRLTPEVVDTFWVNLLGKGYPAPRHKFRWCTLRMKIYPSNKFITDLVKSSGETILILGMRKKESSKRKNVMDKLEKHRIRERLSPNAQLPNSYVFTPIEEWTNDDVWLYLMQFKNPWEYNNKDLLTMYQGASPDGECPLVIDTNTPSCGNSRFGCWTCTLVTKDHSMSAMIQNDEEKEWMLPLMDIRDQFQVGNDRHMRDFRRMSGQVQLFYDRPIPGPYKQKYREKFLKLLLEAQVWMRENGPEHVKDLELVTIPELEEIRRIWVIEKHELEDNLPGIYEDIIGEPYPGKQLDDNTIFGKDEMNILREACDGDLQFEMVRELLNVEIRYRALAKRSGLFGAIEDAIRRSFYEDEDDATDRARRRNEALGAAKESQYKQMAITDKQ